jgi:hypothetical protein
MDEATIHRHSQRAKLRRVVNAALLHYYYAVLETAQTEKFRNWLADFIAAQKNKPPALR